MALFDDINEIKQFNSALSSGVELENIKSYISDAVETEIVPVIGYEQLQDLVKVKSDLQPTDKRYRLLMLIQKAVTGVMIANYSDNGAVMIGNSGISVIRSEKSGPASDKKLMQLKRYNLRSGFNALEMAVQYLEDNINDFPIYKNGDEHKSNRSMLVRTPTEFQNAGVQINKDAQLFNSLKPYLANATETYLAPVLGDIMQLLLDEILSGALSAPLEKLLKKVQKPLAAFTMAEAIPYRVVTIDANGVFELSETVGGISGNVENRSTVTERRLSQLMTGFTMRGEQELEVLRKFLAANAADYNYSIPGEVIMNDGSAPNIYVL